MRDATYVLDEILDNESELNPTEYAVETAGTTEIIFALFNLLSLRFSPRIRDLGEKRFYQAGGMEVPRSLGSRFRSKVNLELIEGGWDNLLRIVGSLKRGHCPALTSGEQAPGLPPAEPAYAALAGVRPPCQNRLHSLLPWRARRYGGASTRNSTRVRH